MGDIITNLTLRNSWVYVTGMSKYNNVYGKWIRIYYVLCLKTVCSGPPLVLDELPEVPALVRLAYYVSYSADSPIATGLGLFSRLGPPDILEWPLGHQCWDKFSNEIIAFKCHSFWGFRQASFNSTKLLNNFRSNEDWKIIKSFSSQNMKSRVIWLWLVKIMMVYV